MTQKDAFLDKIEDCIDLPLNNVAPDLRGRLRRLSKLHLRAVRDAFLLAYQEGYDRAQNG